MPPQTQQELGPKIAIAEPKAQAANQRLRMRDRRSSQITVPTAAPVVSLLLRCELSGLVLQ